MIRNPFRLPRAGRASPAGARPPFKLIPVGFGWLTPLLLGPACALALDIGEIQVHSALNQLFDARIPLPTLTPEELGKISVKLAPSPMFKEFDLDRASTLSNLVFSLEYNAEGQVYVKVISTKPIKEPSLGLLVEFGWPRGKTFREFTVLLDPVQRLAQRPDDRSKTVLNASTATAPAQPVPAAAAPSAQPVPAVAAIAPEPQQDTPPAENPDPVVASKPAVVETVAAPEPIAPVAEAASTPVRVYRPGDTYGPVATGEGLWGIALKVRPDPAITREQMTQALFQANPHAFSKAGIEGLRIGTVLRIPSFQEIANFTGSSAARHLAEVQPLPSLTAPPPLPSSETTESPVAKAAAPEVFPLEPLPLLEPVALTDAPAAPAPESAATAVSAAAPPSDALAELDPIVLEPVSAMSLLFLAISEMMAADIQPSATTIRVDETAAPAPKDPVLPLAVAIADPVAAPVSPTDADTEAPAPAATREFLPQPMDTASLLAAVDLHPPRLDLDTPARAYLASDVSAPMVAVFTQPLPIPVQAAADNDSLSADETDTVKPATVADPPPVLAAGPAATSAKVNETPARTYQGNDQYGPVAPNARLWDIATQVRPDPAISREHMMKALLKANPQAFSKSGNMDSLKIGATLRVPTLQEIVEYTGSKAASQLLEQQQAAPPISPALPPESEPAPAASKPEPEPVTAKPESTSEPTPTASEPEPEAAKPESTPEPAPSASEPEPEAAKPESTPEPASPAPASEMVATPPAPSAPEPAAVPTPVPETPSASPASTAPTEPVSTPPAQEPAANAPVTETPPTPPAESVTTPPTPPAESVTTPPASAAEVAPKPVTETRSAPVTSTETTPASPSPAPITEAPPAPVIETPSAPEPVIATPAPPAESVPTPPASPAPAETVPATPTPEAPPAPAAESVVTPPAPAEPEPVPPPPVPAR